MTVVSVGVQVGEEVVDGVEVAAEVAEEVSARVVKEEATVPEIGPRRTGTRLAGEIIIEKGVTIRRWREPEGQADCRCITTCTLRQISLTSLPAYICAWIQSGYMNKYTNEFRF